MATSFQVSRWDMYEKADSKKCANMQWVAVPINHQGMGFIELMVRPDGVRILGGWLLILQIAAQCPVRGLLVSDGGRILGAREIALKTHAPEADIKLALEALCEMGWMEVVEVDGTRPDAIRTTSGLQYNTRQDKTEQNKTEIQSPCGATPPPPAGEASPKPAVEPSAPKAKRVKPAKTPEQACVDRNAFRVKGSKADKTNALRAAIGKLGIAAVDAGLAEVSDVWASAVMGILGAVQDPRQATQEPAGSRIDSEPPMSKQLQHDVDDAIRDQKRRRAAAAAAAQPSQTEIGLST